MRIASEAGQRVLVVAGAVALAAAAVLQAPAASAVGGGGRSVAVTGTRTRLAPVSSGSLRAIANRGRAAGQGGGARRGAVSGLPGAGLRGAAGAIPDPRSVPVVGSTPGLRGFAGLRAADNGTESNPEPPDQALCVGGGQVMEAVNTVLTVYSTGGSQQIPVVSFGEFFGIREGQRFPPIIFDPSCQFDQQVRRWFVVVTEVDLDQRSGAPTGSHLFLAVSKTADATGGYAIFAVNTTAGDATDRGCPCFDDFPALGADAHGLFVTTNRKTLSTGRGNGAQVYAVAKRGLAAVAASSGPPPVLVSFDAGSVGGAPAAAVHPAITPPGRRVPAQPRVLCEPGLRSRYGAPPDRGVGIGRHQLAQQRPPQAALGLPARQPRTAAPSRAYARGAGDGAGQPAWGVPAHPRRADRPGLHGRPVDGVADPQRGGHRPRTQASRTELACLPGRAG
jgi:hypothetical protein